MNELHRRWLLRNHPIGAPTVKDFKYVEDVVPAARPGHLLIRNLYLSVDPFQRLIMNATPRNVEVVPLFGVMLGDVVGEVIQSSHPEFKEGQVVNGVLGWESHSVSDALGHFIHNKTGLRVVDESLGPLHTAVSVLGRPGMTAYFSVLKECMPKNGDVMLVSTAAGAVGHLAGQIGRLHGAKVVGITSSNEKAHLLTNKLGFESAINYRECENLNAEIREHCPNGIDIFYDATGGKILDIALSHLNEGGRVSHIGVTSQYNKLEENGTPWIWNTDNPMFIVHDYVDEYDHARKELSNWVTQKSLSYIDDITIGFENAPDAFLGLFSGTNIGKSIVQLTDHRLSGALL